MFDPYNVRVRGYRLDPYRVARLFRIDDPALAQALKKLLRAGHKHKDRRRDIEEVISTCQRWLEMENEDDMTAQEEAERVRVAWRRLRRVLFVEMLKPFRRWLPKSRPKT